MKKGIRVFLSVLVIFLLLGGYFVVRYSLWHRDFFVSENITCTSDEKFVVEEKEINMEIGLKTLYFQTCSLNL